MKQTLKILLTVAIAFVFCVHTSIAETFAKGGGIMESEVAQIIESQLSSDEREKLKNSKDFHFSDEPILKVYNEIYWSLAGKPSKEMIVGAEEYSENYDYKDYYVFSDVPYRIRVSHDEIVTEENLEIPSYVQDISDLSQQVEIDGTLLDVKGVYCFDGSTSHNGIIVCIMTEKEALIKYYENLYSDALLFAESEFRVYASEYYTYLTSYENNYNENGEPIGGGLLSFKEFIGDREEDSIIDEMDTHNSVEKIDTNTELSLYKCNHQYLWIGLGLLLMAGAIIIVCYIFKKLKIGTTADKWTSK